MSQQGDQDDDSEKMAVSYAGGIAADHTQTLPSFREVSSAIEAIRPADAYSSSSHLICTMRLKQHPTTLHLTSNPANALFLQGASCRLTRGLSRAVLMAPTRRSSLIPEWERLRMRRADLVQCCLLSAISSLSRVTMRTLEQITTVQILGSHQWVTDDTQSLFMERQ